jgi:hypothetical protein
LTRLIRHTLSTLFLLLFVAGADAQPAAFTRIGFGARGIALGNALAADVWGDASPYYNPALAPAVPRQSLEASAALLTLDRELQYLQFSAPMRPLAGVSAGLIHAAVSNIDGRDESGYHTQTYSADELAAFFAFGLRLGGRLAGGFTFQYFRADYADALEPVNSIGVDLGITASLSENLHLGLVVEDLLAQYSWNTSGLYGGGGRSTTERFPRRIRFGAAQQIRGNLRLMAEYESRTSFTETRTAVLTGDPPRETLVRENVSVRDGIFRLGGEYRLVDALTVRAGVDQLGTGSVKPAVGFSVQQPLGDLQLKGEYALRLEPYGALPMHFITLLVLL